MVKKEHIKHKTECTNTKGIH